MTEKLIYPLDYDERLAEQRAARHQLFFHVSKDGWYKDYAGYKSESRPATDSELALWRALVGDESQPLGTMTAEVYETIQYRSGYFYMNAADLNLLRARANTFVPELEPSRLKRGFIGTILPIYEGRRTCLRSAFLGTSLPVATSTRIRQWRSFTGCQIPRFENFGRSCRIT